MKLNKQQRQIARKALKNADAPLGLTQYERVYAAVEAVLEQQAWPTDEECRADAPGGPLAQRAPVPAPKWFLPEDDVRLGRQIVVTVNGDYSTTKPAPGPPNVGSACGHPTQEQIESWNTHRIPDVSLQGIAPAPQSTEDVVDRMQHAYLDAVEVSEHNACKTGTVCSVGMTAALAEARRGMYNEAEIEKIVEVLKEMEEIYRDVRSAEIDSFTLQPVRLLLARLSAREQPSKEQPVI